VSLAGRAGSVGIAGWETGMHTGWTVGEMAARLRTHTARGAFTVVGPKGGRTIQLEDEESCRSSASSRASILTTP